MRPADYLLFLHSMRYRKGQPIYDAIDLTPRAESLPDGWFGWVVWGSAVPDAVKVVTPHFEIVHSTGPNGSGWTVDGAPIPDLEPAERLRAYVETRTSIGFSPPRLVPLPAFVSCREELAPVVNWAEVRLKDVSIAAFADAFLKQELLDATSLANDPATREILGDEFIRASEARNAQRWEEFRRMTVVEGTMVPAEAVCNDREVGCVARLDRRADGSGDTVFECTLFLADTVPLTPGTVLRRRTGRRPKDQPPEVLEWVVGTVLRVGPAQVLTSVLPVNAADAASASVPGLELQCQSCGARHPASRFDAEAMEVAELTAGWHEVWKELSLLRRTAALYERHPAARDYVKPGAQWIMDSRDPVVIDQLMNNVPFDEIAPPRTPNYEALVERWLGDDPELREFLETSSFDLEARMPDIQEGERKYREQLRGRSVRCPACGDGLLALADPHDD